MVGKIVLKKKAIFTFLLLGIVSYTFSQTTQLDSLKYQNYKLRLKQQFMYCPFDAMQQGAYLPAEAIQLTRDGQKAAYWADATWWQGHYVAMLAMEYRLCQLRHQPIE